MTSTDVSELPIACELELLEGGMGELVKSSTSGSDGVTGELSLATLRMALVTIVLISSSVKRSRTNTLTCSQSTQTASGFRRRLTGTG